MLFIFIFIFITVLLLVTRRADPSPSHLQWHG
jgi:hypothetical protein